MNFPKLRSGAGFLVMILLTDYLVLCAILVPPSIYYVAKTRDGLDPADCGICRYHLVFQGTANMLSSWLEALLAVNRMVAVLLPRHYDRFKRRCIQVWCRKAK
ncbi:hypothetical protein BV898_18378 [Hypsibius exemplaris]|uniref:G-protein coupled receptors family 1 profile domain-containing protein n=1 Tax=Hypsibius exemplaris TaxID=2072580 RepID=A0A9X6NIQ0_HYPEX|nr:hypothetical protein BV898_18378 [Hypsibius exemplaris]